MFHFSYPPSKLENVDYSLFKSGVAPAWEDAAFKNGGRWVIKLEKVKAQSLDDLWLSLSLALIGEDFTDVGGGELVCGAIVSVRRSYGIVTSKALQCNRLSPNAAARLAGRLALLSQATFECTGRATIKPVDTAADSDDARSLGLRAAGSRPRIVPWPGHLTGPFPVLHADAFFLHSDRGRRARWQNGWGFVLFFGVIKSEHLALFSARKAFIYVLEIVALVLPLVTLARCLPTNWIAFIDNVAGQFALKGYGKDPSVNGILASFWGLAADRQWSPCFNVSDAVSQGDDCRARAEGWTRVSLLIGDFGRHPPGWSGRAQNAHLGVCTELSGGVPGREPRQQDRVVAFCSEGSADDSESGHDEKKVMALGRHYREVLAQTPGLHELSTKALLSLVITCSEIVPDIVYVRELTFEDFRKQAVTFVLTKPNSGGEQAAETSRQKAKELVCGVYGSGAGERMVSGHMADAFVQCFHHPRYLYRWMLVITAEQRVVKYSEDQLVHTAVHAAGKGGVEPSLVLPHAQPARSPAAKAHVAGDPCSRLSADLGDSSLEWEAAGSEGHAGCNGGIVVRSDMGCECGRHIAQEIVGPGRHPQRMERVC
ncbi:eIF4E1 [Symbiodinium sp. KB8]|nr:eIF4E1 [Symbiodinium sp. KB8]